MTYEQQTAGPSQPNDSFPVWYLAPSCQNNEDGNLYLIYRKIENVKKEERYEYAQMRHEVRQMSDCDDSGEDEMSECGDGGEEGEEEVLSSVHEEEEDQASPQVEEGKAVSIDEVSSGNFFI